MSITPGRVAAAKPCRVFPRTTFERFAASRFRFAKRAQNERGRNEVRPRANLNHWCYFLLRASRHFPPLRYIKVPQELLPLLPALRLPLLRLAAFLERFFLFAMVCTRLLLPTCDPGLKVAACSSGIGENAAATATARAAMNVFLMLIFRNLHIGACAPVWRQSPTPYCMEFPAQRAHGKVMAII